MKFRPKASEVLTTYLKQQKEPPWTSYFVKYSSVVNDQFGKSHFNWKVNNSNYHILRTGCFPYMKYHCTKRPEEDLTLDDTLFGAIKIINLGIPTFMYGLAATMLITHKEAVHFPKGKRNLHLLNIWTFYQFILPKNPLFKSKHLSCIMPPKGKKKVEKEAVADHELSDSASDSDSEPDKKETKAKPKSKTKKNESAKKERGTKRPKEDKEDAPAKKAKVEYTKPDLKDLNFDCDKSTPNGEKWNFKITTWNVAGLRAWIKKGGLDYVKKEDPDILCLQETKCSENKLPPEAKLPGYHVHWVNGVKEGYAGVALYSKIKPISVVKGLNNKEHDSEGRVITAEYEQFYLVTTYVPNAGQGLKTLPKRLKWDEDFRNYLKELDAKKPVILCGDLNVAHTEIDLANPKTNTKNAGFTPEEREGMTELLKQGFVDTFRHLYPDLTGAYTFWAYFNNARSRNTGWRLDYFIFSERFMPHLCDNVIRNQVHGSDHCPVTLFIHV